MWCEWPASSPPASCHSEVDLRSARVFLGVSLCHADLHGDVKRCGVVRPDRGPNAWYAAGQRLLQHGLSGFSGEASALMGTPDLVADLGFDAAGTSSGQAAVSQQLAGGPVADAVPQQPEPRFGLDPPGDPVTVWSMTVSGPSPMVWVSGSLKISWSSVVSQ